VRTLTRRRLLLHAIASAPTLACTTRIALGAPESAAGGSSCTFAVATLRRGLPIGFDNDPLCRTPTGSSAIFQAASLSKPVVAILALKLALRGVLDLDQPLSAFLPDGYAHRQNLFALREPPVVDVVPREVLRKLTARTLLSHTSGFPNWSSAGPLRLGFEPGSQWQYSGEGFVLLQHVLHAMTGKPLQELASEELFEPLGLRHCAFKLTDHIARSLVPGRSASGVLRQMRFPFEIAANSLYTSAGDYARFMSSVLADEPMLSLITRAPVPVPRTSNVNWGLGWGLERASDRTFIWHWGNNPGFRALAMADLETKDAVVVLTATESGMPLAKERVREALPGPHPGFELGLVQ
jgi:CubicO group peptidase (beta-lactamase class C family)